jgi:putative peptide zinc metalloprotease protein
MSDRSTFSPFWHRVRALRPRLRAHVQISRQIYRGQRWYVAHDPSSNQYFRFGAVAHDFVGLLDGRRTVEEVWESNLSRFGDEALTQNDAIQVLSQLHNGNLLQADLNPETEQLLTRGRERFQKKFVAQAIGLMYFKVPLVNPNRWLDAIEPIFRPLIGRVGLLSWCVLVVAALVALTPHWDALRSGFTSAIAPSNWGWLLAVYVLTKLWHETGHGVICKRFGGQVPEAGAMMLVLVPSPYVDASSAWTFADKWKRIAVGAGGMMFELTIAAIAAFVWIATRDNPGLTHQLAYNIMLTSGVSTILFNANPLMRFDGYYMLSDLLEVPNLAQRSNRMLQFLFQRHLYKADGAQAPTSNLTEAGILLTYGVLAFFYRLFIFFTITLYVMGIAFAIGLFLAVWTVAMWFILPVGKFVHWLATSPQLNHKRPRAILASLALAGAVLLVVGAIPMPDHRRAQGVVQSAERHGIFSRSDAFLAVAHARGGERVQAGDPLFTLESPELDASLALARAQLEELRSREQQASAGNAAAAQVARQFVQSVEERVAYLESQQQALVLRSPIDGVVVLPLEAARPGAYLTQGVALAEVIDPDRLRVVAPLSQGQADWIASMPPDRFRVEARRASRVHHVVTLRPDRLPTAGRKDLPHAALGFAGGGAIEVDQQSGSPESARLAKRNFFNASFVVDSPAHADETSPDPDAPSRPATESVGMPGERVALRFTLPRRPWLFQWLDRLDQTLQGRARI